MAIAFGVSATQSAKADGKVNPSKAIEVPMHGTPAAKLSRTLALSPAP